MCDGNYIKLNRKIAEWGWYRNQNTKAVFLHCLIKANWKDAVFEGKVINRGSFVTSRKVMSAELGLSEQEIRTALEHLKSTNELTIKGHTKYTVITVNNYDFYQDSNQQNNQQSTNNQPTINQQSTTIEEVKKERKKEIKHIYGEYSHVRLTETEFERLGTDYGEALRDDAIKYLDEYMQMKSKKYADCNLAIRKWVIEAVRQKKPQERKDTDYEQREKWDDNFF